MADADYTSEVWKPISFFDRYDVSSFGRVRSRLVRPSGRILTPVPTPKGYLRVGLKGDKPWAICIFIHRLVAQEFLGLKPWQIVNHMDGNRQNNNLDNLEVMGKDTAEQAIKGKNGIQCIAGLRDNKTHEQISRWLRAIVRSEVRKILQEERHARPSQYE